MSEIKSRLMYCSKCGDVFEWKMGNRAKSKCLICGGNSCFDVNPDYLGIEDYNKIWKQLKYGEKTREQCKTEEEELFREFREKVVKKHPNYDPYYFEHREEIKKQINETWKRGASKTIPTIKCPYCKSTNTKKLSAVSRGLSFSVFGFGSKKIGKQWHCNSCGSDF